MANSKKQNGSVSLFVVIFAALLITIVTVSFVRIMVKDQQQANATDLSQSAYDSAQAGVEDAKRALLKYQSICASDPTSSDCATAAMNVASDKCNVAVGTLTDIGTLLVASDNKEVKVQTGTDNALNQAYTCVTITLNTDDYLGELKQDESKLIPLVGVSDFDTIKLEWFSAKDLQGTGMTVDLPTVIDGVSLFNQNDWQPNQPSIMRTQLIQFNGNFSLTDFDGNDNASTQFLYPTSAISDTLDFTNNLRKTAIAPKRVHCLGNLNSGGYACSATMILPLTGARIAYLRLTSLYKKANYRITLLNGAIPVQFNAVQPEIDSTGRANNVFRRVKSRVELTDVNFPYPEAAVDVTSNFCKDFPVTDDPDDYNNYINSTISCKPQSISP